MLHRAKAAGYTAIVVTVDATVFSNRERTTRLLSAPLPNLPMGNAPRTPGVTGSATVMKVDLNWDDIEFCRKESGLPVIVKSILSAKQALEAERRGCSANVVALGRPVLYGSALGGSLGVQSVHEHLKGELVMVMQLAGTPTIKSITRDYVSRAELEA
jgi:isopentenyl diphosphate isomerase/L-lactate dehydrogenase-like FMN-dependent dehydrogenase